MSRKTKIFILADIPILRRGMAVLIDEDEAFTVSGEAAEPHEALVKLEEDLPDIVVCCIPLKPGNGNGVLEQIGRRHPELPVLVVSTDDTGDEAAGRRARELGARGYVAPDAPGERTIEAIREIARGGLVFCE